MSSDNSLNTMTRIPAAAVSLQPAGSLLAPQPGFKPPSLQQITALYASLELDLKIWQERCPTHTNQDEIDAYWMGLRA